MLKRIIKRITLKDFDQMRYDQHTDPMFPEYTEIREAMLLFQRCNQDGRDQKLQFWNNPDQDELL